MIALWFLLGNRTLVEWICKFLLLSDFKKKKKFGFIHYSIFIHSRSAVKTVKREKKNFNRNKCFFFLDPFYKIGNQNLPVNVGYEMKKKKATSDETVMQKFLAAILTSIFCFSSSTISWFSFHVPWFHKVVLVVWFLSALELNESIFSVDFDFLSVHQRLISLKIIIYFSF